MFYFNKRKYLKLGDKLHQTELKTENPTRNTFIWEPWTIKIIIIIKK